MKKTVAAAIAAALVLTTSAALAAPVEFDGEVKQQYRWETYNFDRDKDGGISTIRLNAKMELDKNVSVYARFAAQTLSGDHIGKDFNKDSSSIATIDQYGFIYNNAGWNYKIGRQSLAITPTASLISSGAYIGENLDFLNGVVATGKSGVTSLQFVAGNVDHVSGSNSDSVYSIHGSYSPAENWTVGGTLAHAKLKVEGDRNFWGVDAAYTAGKASFIVDYLNSNSSSNDAARVFGVDYAFDGKNTLSVYNHKTELNADIFTDWDQDQKGFYYIYNHNFDKTTSFTLLFKDNEYLNSTDDYTSLRATVAYKF
jgi:hypothetical protein